MSQKGPSSPGKNRLIEQAKALPKLEHKSRELISSGAQSIIISDGHNHVLLVTRYVVAKKFEQLREHPPIRNSTLIELPILAGVNADVIALLLGKANPSNHSRNRLKKELGLSPDLLTQNIVYRLPRYEGNLETLGRVRFKEDSIEKLEHTLYSTIEELHDAGFTHNDICKKNVLYKGTYPNITFRLCDWGSVTQSCSNNEQHKYDMDYQKVGRVVGQVKDMLVKREKFKEKAQSNPLMAGIFSRKVKELNISPTKPENPRNKNTPTEQKPKLDRVKVNLLSQLTKEESADIEESKEDKPKTLLVKFKRTKKVFSLVEAPKDLNVNKESSKNRQSPF